MPCGETDLSLDRGPGQKLIGKGSELTDKFAEPAGKFPS
jgi:hypothetical protein